MPEYGKIVTTLNIQAEGNTSGKKTCTEKTEYIKVEDGVNTSITYCNDGFSWVSKPLNLPLQKSATPITEKEYEKALVTSPYV